MIKKTRFCPKCKTNIGIVDFTNYFKCVFCGSKVYKKGQRTLRDFKLVNK